MEIYYTEYETPIGLITLGCVNNDIVLCGFGKVDVIGKHQETDCLKEAAKQLNEYFNGTRKVFQLSYRFLNGTDFQRKVWQALLDIPYGKTASYKDIAKKVGSPQASRAVGGANHCNPIAIFIPCHRVIGANKRLVGYAGGLDKKSFLLNLEKQNMISNE